MQHITRTVTAQSAIIVTVHHITITAEPVITLHHIANTAK